MHSNDGLFRLFHFTCTDQKTGRFAEEKNETHARQCEECQHALKVLPIGDEAGQNAEENVIGRLWGKQTVKKVKSKWHIWWGWGERQHFVEKKRQMQNVPK